MRIHFFGKLGDRLGRAVELAIPPGVERVGQLRRHLAGLYPDAAADLSAAASRPCIGDAIVAEDHPVGEKDLVEFFPPLSGG